MAFYTYQIILRYSPYVVILQESLFHVLKGLLICLKGSYKERGRETGKGEIFQFLILSPNSNISQVWAIEKVRCQEHHPGPSNMGAGTQGFELSFIAFRGVLTRSWIRDGADGIWTSTVMGSQQWRQLFNTAPAPFGFTCKNTCSITTQTNNYTHLPKWAENFCQDKTCMRMFIEALCVNAKNWKQPSILLQVNEQTNNIQEWAMKPKNIRKNLK